MNEKKIPLIVVVGPTASGKTEISIELAKRYNGEIVSADSMQIYKSICIGTAQPSIDEMQGIPHHLIGFKGLEESFSVASYVTLAADVIADIHKRGKQAILCGGTGLYVNALTGNIEFSEMNKDDSVKAELDKIFQEHGKEKLFSMLLEADPEEAKIIDKDNPVRLIRALEVCRLTGKTMTEYKRKNLEASSEYNCLKIGIDYKNRAELYDRINCRVAIMEQSGLLDEAKLLFECDNPKTALQAIGYKELFDYFKGEMPLDEALDDIRQASRRYAKRQLSWFRRDKEINWFYKTESTELEEYKRDIFMYVDEFMKSV